MGFGSPPQAVVRRHFEGTKRPPVRRSRRGRLPWGWIWLAILPATILHAEYPSKIINGLRATCLETCQEKEETVSCTLYCDCHLFELRRDLTDAQVEQMLLTAERGGTGAESNTILSSFWCNSRSL
jgi:hypothetical protein